MTDEAINRYKRNAQAREDAQRKRSHANFKSIVFGLLVVVAIVYWLAYKDNIDWENFSIASVTEFFRSGENASEPSSAAAKAFRDRYVSIAAEFGRGELAHWKDVPKKLKPKYAPAGTVYHALVPRARGFDLYELKGGGKATEITPFGEPVPLTFADFKKSVGEHPYFIACGGRVFVCGGGDLKTMDETRRALLPR